MKYINSHCSNIRTDIKNTKCIPQNDNCQIITDLNGRVCFEIGLVALEVDGLAAVVPMKAYSVSVDHNCENVFPASLVFQGAVCSAIRL